MGTCVCAGIALTDCHSASLPYYNARLATRLCPDRRLFATTPHVPNCLYYYHEGQAGRRETLVRNRRDC